MRTPALFLGALAAAWAALASPLGPAAAELAARGLTVHEAEWQVQAFRDGPLLQLNGTVQEVHRQLTALNPNYEADFGGNATEAGDVEARGEYWADSKVTCGAPWYGYTERGYNEAVHYLSWHKGRPNMGAGPRQCWRVSCSWNTGVYICNDNAEPYSIRSWMVVADGIVRAHQCNLPLTANLKSTQIFHWTNWNIITRWDEC